METREWRRRCARARCLDRGGRSRAKRGCARHALSRPGHWSSTVSTGAFFLMYSSSNSLAHAPFLPATTTRERRAVRRWARGTGTTRETGRAAIADAIFARVCVIAPAPSLATWPRLERFLSPKNKTEARRAPTPKRRVARHAPLGGPDTSGPDARRAVGWSIRASRARRDARVSP